MFPHNLFMSGSIGQQLRRRARELELSDAEVARRADLSPRRYSNYVKDDREPDFDTLLKICEVLGCRPDYLFGLGDAPSPAAEDRAEAPAPAPAPATVNRPEAPTAVPLDEAGRREPVTAVGSLPMDVPVLGNAVGGPDGYTEFNNGAPVDYVRRPAGIARARSVYALYVVGDLMEPRFRPGALVYANPSRPVQVDGDVVVQLQPEDDGAPPRAYVKRLVRVTPTTVVVKQFNPEQKIVYDRAHVLSLHYVMETHEVLGL